MPDSHLAFTCCILVLVLLGNQNEMILSGQSINRLLMIALARLRLSSCYKPGLCKSMGQKWQTDTSKSVLNYLLVPVCSVPMDVQITITGLL